MPSVVHTLGELEHVYDRQNLKLRTRGFVKLCSPQAFEFPFSMNFQNLEALVSSQLWVAGGNRLQIQIDVSFDDIEITGLGVSEAIESLGIVLCSAEIWPQLYLHASLSLPENPIDKDTGPQGIVISLTGQPLSHVNLQPPTAVPSARLESVSFTLELSTCRRTRIPSNRQSSKVIAELDSSKKRSLDIHATQDCMDRCQDLPWLSQIPGRTSGRTKEGRQLRTACLSVDGNELSSALSRVTSPTASPMHSQDSILSIATLGSAQDCTSAFQSSTSHSEYATHMVDFEDVVKVVDASLQVMICGRRPAKAGGLVLSSDEGYPKLAALSPALFSPGYAQAISRRDSLLSTISHTLSNVHRHTLSRNLRSKIEQLLNMAPDKYVGQQPSCEDTESRGSNLTSSIHARLWFLIQHRLTDPLASTRFKSLDASKRAFKSGLASENMLEELLRDDKAGEPLFDSQDTLWDEDVSQDKESFGQNAIETEVWEDALLMEKQTPVGNQIASEDLSWEELSERDDLLEESHGRFKGTNEPATPNESYREQVDGTEEILDDDIVHEYQTCVGRYQLGRDFYSHELLEAAEMSMAC